MCLNSFTACGFFRYLIVIHSWIWGSTVLKNNCDVQSAFLPLYFTASKIPTLHMTKSSRTGDKRPGWAQKEEKLTWVSVCAVAWVANPAHWGVQTLAVPPKPSFLVVFSGCNKSTWHFCAVQNIKTEKIKSHVLITEEVFMETLRCDQSTGIRSSAHEHYTPN